jgi:hypothetical protein
VSKAKNKKIKTVRREENTLIVIYQWALLKTVMETSPRPVCILCNAVMQHSSMAPSKLKRHFETKHRTHKGKPVIFLQRMLNNLSSMKAYIHTKFKSENALTVSMKVSYRTART